MRKNIKFCFHYPPTVLGIYDTGEGIIYVFGSHNTEGFEDILAHETLHFVVQKMAGKEASLALDNISKEFLIPNVIQSP